MIIAWGAVSETFCCNFSTTPGKRVFPPQTIIFDNNSFLMSISDRLIESSTILWIPLKLYPSMSFSHLFTIIFIFLCYFRVLPRYRIEQNLSKIESFLFEIEDISIRKFIFHFVIESKISLKINLSLEYPSSFSSVFILATFSLMSLAISNLQNLS